MQNVQHKIIKLKEIDSTHKFALRMIEDGIAFECGIIADTQTDGVGRYGRKWISERGNLYASVIRSFSEDIKNKNMIPLAVVCAIHEVISEYVRDKNHLHLHWPNDIYYKSFKVSGILIAVVGEWTVISTGVNIHPVSASNSISLEDIADIRGVSAIQIFEAILDKLGDRLGLPKINDFFGIKEYWLKNMTGINEKARVKNKKGIFYGVIRGINDSGSLVLEDKKDFLFISSGDMFLED